MTYQEQKQIIDTRSDKFQIVLGLLKDNIVTDYYKLDKLFVLHSSFVGWRMAVIEMN
jgi:hypothetical protein